MTKRKRNNHADLAKKNAAAPQTLHDGALSIGAAVGEAMFPAGTQPLASDAAPPAEPAKAKRSRTATPKAMLPDVDIDPELLADTRRMNYVLVLALLSKCDGRMEFSHDDLDVDDTAYNVVFARTLDKKKIVVSVVSNQSGILRTPAAGDDKIPAWPQPTKFPGTEFLPPPSAGSDPLPSKESMLEATRPELTPQDKYLQAAAAEQALTAPATDSARPLSPFPFEVGDRPAATLPMDLASFAREKTASAQVESDQMKAAARVESQGH